ALTLKTSTLLGVKDALLSPALAIGGTERRYLGRRAMAQALHTADLAIRAKRFAMAWSLLELARALQERAAEGEVPIPVSAKELAALKPAFAKLDQDAEDAAANFQVGKFLCLVLEHWPVGLPLLAKAHDPLWRAAAQAELKHPTNAAGHGAVGDAWYHLFHREPRGAERRSLGWRVRAWYDLTLSELPPAQRGPLTARVREIGGAPNLSLIKPFFDANATSPKSGLPVHKTEPKLDMESGYAIGRWFMSTHGGHWYGGDITRYAAPFACQLTARVASPPSAWYELVFSHENGKHSYIVRVDGAGAVELFMGDEQAQAEIPLGAIRPKGVRPQAKFGNLLVIGRARQIDLYLDGVPLMRAPIRLPVDIGPGQVHIGLVSGNNGGGLIEVKRLTVWPADAVPPLKGRS
ncbi:MAG TPA: hypothetical protein VFA18_23335, partial [Gemmataceae bacterium]|nr:hypothetical protein [Gemmataceae bacterium]